MATPEYAQPESARLLSASLALRPRRELGDSQNVACRARCMYRMFSVALLSVARSADSA
jgi:hypothetical protein